jgi:hypothetical protein
VLVVVVPVAVPALRHRRVRVDEPRLRLQHAPDVAVVLHDDRGRVRQHRRRQLLHPEHRERPRQSIVSEIDGDLRSSRPADG